MKLRRLVPRALRPALSQAKMRVKRLARHLPGRPDPVFARFPFRRLVRSPWGWLWTEGGQQAWCNPRLGPELSLA